MSSVLIKELGRVITGNTPSKNNNEFYSSKDIGFIKPDVISDEKITYIKSANEFISEQARSKARIVKKNAVLVTCIGIIGKICIVKDGEYAFNQQINAIEPNEKVSSEYLAYCLLYNKNRLTHIANAPVVPIINKTQFENFQINIIDRREKQDQIAEILNRVNNVINMSEKQIGQFDALIKSRFVEIFGNPELNDKNWKVEPVIEKCECMVPGRDKPKSFTGEIPWITIDDLNVNGVTYESKSGLGLTQDEIDKVKRKVVPAGSVLMSCVGNLGICSIAGREMIINQQLHSFQCSSDLNNIYLMYNLANRKDYMEKWASRTTVLYMNKTVCNSIPIMLPPLELQNQFAAFVHQVDKLKAAEQKRLEQTQILFDSLMQQYFG